MRLTSTELNRATFHSIGGAGRRATGGLGLERQLSRSRSTVDRTYPVVHELVHELPHTEPFQPA
jgi:hypothetical protein